jgi:hypothetical protein
MCEPKVQSEILGKAEFAPLFSPVLSRFGNVPQLSILFLSHMACANQKYNSYPPYYIPYRSDVAEKQNGKLWNVAGVI